jgi:phosphatidylglycerophosphate synthase
LVISELRPLIQRRTANVYDTWFTRRVSIYLTVAFAKLGATPNQVSVLGAFVGAACCLLLALGQGPWLWVGVACMHLYAVLDSVDGEIARWTKRFSLLGLFIEDLSAYVMINAFNLAIGFRLYTDAHWTWPLAAAVGIAAFGRNVMPVARRALLKSVFTGRPPAELAERTAPGPASKWRELIQENVLHSTNQWVVLSALLGLAGTGIVPYLWVAVMFGAIMALLAAREVAGLLRLVRGDQLERELARIYLAAARTPESTADGLALAKYSVL